MSEHHIEGLVGVSLGQIKEMLGINTIVGDPIMTPSGDTILPISRVGVGFVAGGSDIHTDHQLEHKHEHSTLTSTVSPFGGGTGGGVSITPIAFLVVGSAGVKVVPLDNQTHLIDRVIDSAPGLIDKFQSMMKGSQTSTQGSTSTQGTQENLQGSTQDFSVGTNDYSV